MSARAESAAESEEEKFLDANGKLKRKLIRGLGEECLIHYDEAERPVLEEMRVSAAGKADYSSRTEIDYRPNGSLKSKKCSSSYGEERLLEFDEAGQKVSERLEIRRHDGSTYYSMMRMEYYEDGKLRQRFFEDSDGEKRRTEYDKSGRKKLEDLRFVSPGKSGYVARTEYTYTTDEVFFRSS